MRFAENGYYIEEYVKCDNCGVLIYGDGFKSTHAGDETLLFCTHWCIEWHRQKHAGVESPVIDSAFEE